MKNKLILSSLLITILPCFQAQAKSKNIANETHYRTAEIDISLSYFNKKKATIHLRIPSQQAYGFNGKSTNTEQDEKVNGVIDDFKLNISKIISLGDGCAYEIGGIEKFADAFEKSSEYKNGELKNVKTEYWVFESNIFISCNKDLNNKIIYLSFDKYFKDIDRISVRLNSAKNRDFIISKPSGNFKL
jgi:hypothetical protein